MLLKPYIPERLLNNACMSKRCVIILAIVVAAGLGYLYWSKAPQAEEMRNVEMLTQPGVAITEQDGVDYYGEAKGFYAAPSDLSKNYPGVVMIHEWLGLNDHIKDMARQLAAQGYQVLAVDMYNGEVASGPDRARELSSAVRANTEEGNRNLRAAAEYLREQKASKIASLGWCFGGQQSLHLALSGEQLDATVIYYGNLITDKQKLAALKWPVLGIFGDADTAVPVQSARDFDAALDELGVANSIHIYPGLGHAFANPSGMNYAAEATKDAWAKTLAFLEANLK